LAPAETQMLPSENPTGDQSRQIENDIGEGSVDT